jgi:D-alanyl-D-alanine carboxypeptidase
MLALTLPFAALAAPYASIVMDARTGEVLHSKNAETRLHPASLTKMLTLYIAFQAIERGEIGLDTKVKISAHAAGQAPSKLGLKAGQRIALRYLIRAAAVKSANDCATAIAEAISGSEAEFAQRMNRTAKQLGMTSSTFRNANGLTAKGHLSTARDMTVLGRHLFYDFPQYYNIFSRRTTDAGVAEVANTNRRFLDAYRGADGIKTGYTNPAGFNLTASAERDGVRLVATVFGGTSTAQRNAKMAELLDLGFRKAPRNAPVRAPQMLPATDPEPEIAGTDGDGATMLADSGEGEGPAKTLRLVGAVQSSPRPLARPASGQAADLPAERVASIQEGVAGALAEAAVAAAATPDPAPEAALTGVLADPATVGAAELVAATGAADAGIAPGTPAARPDSAPVTLAAAATAEDQGPAPADVAAALPADAATENPAAALVGVVAEDAAAPLVGVVADPATVGIAEPSAAPPPPAAVLLAQAAAPKPRPAVFIDADQEPLAVPAEPEVVTRISTSGGRHWGVNVGRFTTRGTAERALLKIQLAESATLGDGLRKVVERGGGYDATFMGLAEDQADLACRRLQARAVACATVGP